MVSLRLPLIGFIFITLFSYQVQAETVNSLLEQSQQNMALGHFYEATRQLQQLEAKSIHEQDDYTATLAKGLQGYIALQRQDNTTAEQLLTLALSHAQQKSWSDLTVRFAVYLGEFHERQQNLTQARHYFNLAQTLADTLPDKSFLISSLINEAKLAIATHQFEMALQQLQQAQTWLEKQPISQTSSQLWLSLGYQFIQLYELKDSKIDASAKAFYALNQALSESKALSQRRIQANSLRYLALLYQQSLPTEAIKLLLQSVQIAQNENAQDILLDANWQLGRLYKTQHQSLEAITAYRDALKYLENMRLDIPISYQKEGTSSFKNTFAPLYMELADLLLQQASLAGLESQQLLLKEVQATLELMKKSELEDYFQNRCDIATSPIDLKQADPSAAAIYPIVLPNRLEIIVYTANGLHQFTQPMNTQELIAQALLFSKNLREYAVFERSTEQAQQLYRWLIYPIKSLLEQQKIQTLIYIPDGALRLVPLAALYDGKKFLIESYAVVNSVGMTLMDSSKLLHKNQQILLAGMSKPGDVITDLPNSLLNAFITASSVQNSEKRQLTRDLKLRGDTQKPFTEEKIHELRELLKNKIVIEHLKEELSLPGVETEIKGLANQNAMPYFLNEDFSLNHFSELVTTQPHKILHIASHGFFGSTAEESFIMTYDKILTMNQLEILLNSTYLKTNPIDLITLSACQTAEGDDRSPLGISGIAIKAKVHSALGSLWMLADNATSQLMPTFYQALKEPGVTKAKALQQAQISLLKQKQFENPSFWSPFILVGDWL